MSKNNFNKIVKFTEKTGGYSSPIEFAKFYNIPLLTTFIPSSYKNPLYLREALEQNISIFTEKSDVKNSNSNNSLYKYSTFPQYPNEKKPEIALILTKKHISVLYKSKNGKLFFIDNGGIKINDKPFIKNLVENKGFNYIKVNALCPENVESIKEDIKGNSSIQNEILDFVTRISLNEPINEIEEDICYDSIKYRFSQVEEQGIQSTYCVQTAMAICLMFQKAQSEGKELDLTKIISNFNTLENLQSLKRSNSLVTVEEKKRPSVIGLFENQPKNLNQNLYQATLNHPVNPIKAERRKIEPAESFNIHQKIVPTEASQNQINNSNEMHYSNLQMPIMKANPTQTKIKINGKELRQGERVSFNKTQNIDLGSRF